MSFPVAETAALLSRDQSTAIASYTHDKGMAARFLAILDPDAQRFTFQLFSDGDDPYAEIFHGTLDGVWPKIQLLNTLGRRVAVFVTINETDFQGRRRENIVRARALWVDADSADQIHQCQELIDATGVAPTMVVRSSPDRAHYYWCCDDIGLEDFAAYQATLIEALGTDPAVKDLPRVMRLPGTIHLKGQPQLVTLGRSNTQPRRYKLEELTTRLKLTTNPAPVDQLKDTESVFTRADTDRLRRIFRDQYLAHNDDLSAGIEINIEEIKSAVTAIPHSAISTEHQWMKFARGLAHEARIYRSQAGELWQVLDAHSRSAAGYDQDENRERWARYIDEAMDRDKPITVATVFDMAKRHGWTGWSPTAVTSPGNASTSLTGTLAAARVSFANIPHRRWLYGVDLVRGEITLLAAPGGVGKSSLALGMSLAAATSRALLNERVWDSPLTSLYVNAEDSAIEMRRRIWAFCLHQGVKEQDLKNFALLGADDWQVQKLSFLRTDKGASLLNDAGIQHLERILDEFHPDVLVLDPLVALCGGGNLNDNAAMSLVMRALKRVATKFDCAILVLHHTRKGGDLSHADAIGGASAIVNLARRALMAVPISPDEAPGLGVLPSERSAYFKIVSSKSNLAPRSEHTPWYKLCNVTLPNAEPPTYAFGDGVQAIERIHLPRSMSTTTADGPKVRRAILNVVARGKLIGGQLVPYSPTISGAKNERALIDDAVRAAKAATTPREWHEADIRAVTERAIDALKSEGALVEKDIKGGRFRRGRGLGVDWSRTPWANECSTTDAIVKSAAATEPDPDAHGGQSVNGGVND